MYAIRNGYMLIEMTIAEYLKSAPERDLRPVHFTTAHEHVRAGGCHETPLWIDGDGRIRRATDE
jgi:hypothetical protein